MCIAKKKSFTDCEYPIIKKIIINLIQQYGSSCKFIITETINNDFPIIIYNFLIVHIMLIVDREN